MAGDLPAAATKPAPEKAVQPAGGNQALRGGAKGKLVALNVTDLDLGALTMSLFGDHEDAPR